MSNVKKLMASAAGGEEIIPEGVSFNTANSNMLLINEDLTGNSDGKTFTFSCWVYLASNSGNIYENGYSNEFYVYYSGGNVRIRAENSAGTMILYSETPVRIKNTWVHILASYDMDSLQNSKIYIDDKDYTPVTYWDTFSSGQQINFTVDTTHRTGLNITGRIAHLYRDSTFRNLSIESNRRAFITEDLKPALIESSVDAYSLGTFYVGDRDGEPHGMALSDDGLHLIITGGSGRIWRYDLSTAWDITSASYVDNLSVTAKDGSPRGLQFNNDGTKLYFLGWDSDALHQYTMSTPYDVSTAVFSTTLSSVASLLPYEVRFKPDGTKLYAFDAFNDAFYQWNLTTAWDISTATGKTSNDLGITLDGAFYISSDGTKIYAEGSGSLKELTMSTPWDINTLSFTRTATNNSIGLNTLVSMYTNGDGTILYTLDGYSSGTDTITQYTMSGYDIETAVPATVYSGAVSPILYLPMRDADTAGVNEGTAQDFLPNGPLDTAQRGPNQDNCVASIFETSDRMYVYNTTIPNGSYFLTSFTLNTTSLNSNGYLLFHGRIQIAIETSYAPGRLRFNIANTSGDTIFQAELRNRPIGVQNHYTFAYDASTATYQLYENGVSITFDDVGTQTTGTIHYEDSSYYAIGDGSNNRSAIGEFYLDNADIDLSADNPFWDYETNKPVPVRKVLAETGNTPYIAMPLNTAYPELNLGIGDQGQGSSLPYEGYRGGSEFWAKTAAGDGDTIASNGLTATDNKYLSLSGWFWTQSSSNMPLMIAGTAAGYVTFYANNDYLFVSFPNVVNIGPLYTTLDTNRWHHIFLGIDGQNQQYAVYIDGVRVTGNTTWSSGNIDWNNSSGWEFGGYGGRCCSIYAHNSYIDFTQDSNRFIFRDNLGYPKDLTPAIENGDIPNPIVYLKFDDPSALGTNSGTGGDFNRKTPIIQYGDIWFDI
jgi:hypothetical protein